MDGIPPGASDQPAAQECPDLDLLDPSGSAVDLTGTWQANDFGLYDLHQDGSCLYWLGMSRYADSEPGEYWTNVLYATIRTDFSIAGHWGSVPHLPESDLGNGEITLEIGFESSADGSSPFLRAVNATGGFGGTAWVPVEALPAAVELEGTFGGNYDHLLQTGCFWLESGTDRFELIGSGGLDIRGDPPLRVEDSRGRVLARVGDPIRAQGRVSASLGTNCVESAILVDELIPPQ